jgi:EmrB/QacA subfamily drug resistance transporter
MFMGLLDSSIVAVALPVIGPHLHLSYSEALWVQVAYILVMTVLVVPVGRLADRHGPLRLYALGVIVFGLFSVVAALSPDGLFLVMARGVQAVGGALLTTTSPAIVTAAFPPEERGRALGLNIMAATIGLSCGPPLGGLIATHLGWRWIFLINVPVAAITLMGGWDLLGAERRDRAIERARRGIGAGRRRLDSLGAALLGLTLAALFVPLSFSPLWGWTSGRTIGLLAASVVLAVFFIYLENRVQDPLLDIRLLRHNRVFAAGNAAALLCFGAMYGVTIFTALFLEVVQGHSAQNAGLVLLIQPAISTVLAPFTGLLSDRVGSRGLAVAGMLVVAAATAQLALVSSASPTSRFLAALATLGLGMAFFGAPNMSAVMGSVDRTELGMASGVRFTTIFSGQGLSIAMLGAIAAARLGPTGGRLILLGQSAGVSSARAFAAGYREAMLVGVGLAIGGALVSSVRERRSSKPEPRGSHVIPPP